MPLANLGVVPITRAAPGTMNLEHVKGCPLSCGQRNIRLAVNTIGGDGNANPSVRGIIDPVSRIEICHNIRVRFALLRDRLRRSTPSQNKESTFFISPGFTEIDIGRLILGTVKLSGKGDRLRVRSSYFLDTAIYDEQVSLVRRQLK